MTYQGEYDIKIVDLMVSVCFVSISYTSRVKFVFWLKKNPKIKEKN